MPIYWLLIICLILSPTPNPEPSHLSWIIVAYVIFVVDAADIVHGAKFFMWSNFNPHENCRWSYGTKLLHMTSNLAPHEQIVSHVE